MRRRRLPTLIVLLCTIGSIRGADLLEARFRFQPDRPPRLEGVLRLTGGEIRVTGDFLKPREVEHRSLGPKAPRQSDAGPPIPEPLLEPLDVGRRRRPRRGPNPGVPSPGLRATEPLEILFEKGRKGILELTQDQRMVQQRLLPPSLSQPFHLRMELPGVRWEFAYDSGREGYHPGSVEDQVSAPVLAAWNARDPAAFRATAFGQAIESFLSTTSSAFPASPLATHRELEVEIRSRQAGAPPTSGKLVQALRERLFALPGPPSVLQLELRVCFRETQAFLGELVQIRGIPSPRAQVKLESSIGRSFLGSGVTNSEGRSEIEVRPRGPERIHVTILPADSKVPEHRSQLAWRWGRPVEAWLDRGRPRFAPLPPGTPPKQRLRVLVTSLYQAYSPDDGNFHGAGGSTGMDPMLVRHVLDPALGTLGGLPELPDGTDPQARVELERCWKESLGNGSSYLTSEWMKNPDLAPVPEVPPESLLDSLDDANRDLQELAPDFWSVGLASAASKAAFLIQRRPAPFHPMFEEPLQTFLTEMLRRAEASHQANRPGVLTKAGPTGPVPDLEEGWLGHLFLCHVLLTRKAPEDRWRRQLDRFQKALARKKPPLGHEGIAARTLGELVQRFGLTELRGESARMLDEVWSAALRNGEDHTLEERLRLLQGYLIFP